MKDREESDLGNDIDDRMEKFEKQKGALGLRMSYFFATWNVSTIKYVHSRRNDVSSSLPASLEKPLYMQKRLKRYFVTYYEHNYLDVLADDEKSSFADDFFPIK